MGTQHPPLSHHQGHGHAHEGHELSRGGNGHGQHEHGDGGGHGQKPECNHCEDDSCGSDNNNKAMLSSMISRSKAANLASMLHTHCSVVLAHEVKAPRTSHHVTSFYYLFIIYKLLLIPLRDQLTTSSGEWRFASCSLPYHQVIYTKYQH